MNLKIKFIFFFFFITSWIYSSVNIDYNDFLKKTDNQLLIDLFTLNIGIMKFKTIGNINLINPLDSQNVLNSIKNVLEKVPAAQLSRKEACIKATDIYISKLKEGEQQDALFLKDKFFYMNNYNSTGAVYELFLLLNKNKDFEPVARSWFENIENPFFALNIPEPPSSSPSSSFAMERILLSNDAICESQKTNGKGPLDILISGEIERIDKTYFITIFVYSQLLKKILKEISYVSDSENLSNKTVKEFSSIIPSVFNINYASLKINTNDKDTEVYLNSNYLGKDNVSLDFLVPGNYIVTLKKQGYEDKIENISLFENENKEINLTVEKKTELQAVNLYIEPLGTKIFINSLYMGKTPLKLALKKGSYIISAKNDLYESYRYILNIDNITKDELNVVFHLKSKTNYNYFKIKKYVYYAAFWNFTFSLITTIPLLIFAVEQWDRAGAAYALITPNSFNSYSEYLDFVNKNKDATNILYGFAAAFTVNTVLSAGWLIYALVDYLLALEKRDFIPIIEFYKNQDSKNTLSMGLKIKF